MGAETVGHWTRTTMFTKRAQAHAPATGKRLGHGDHREAYQWGPNSGPRSHVAAAPARLTARPMMPQGPIRRQPRREVAAQAVDGAVDHREQEEPVGHPLAGRREDVTRAIDNGLAPTRRTARFI
jgi:hypothetical protein